MFIQFWNLELISKKRGKAVKIYLGRNLIRERLSKELFVLFSTNFLGATMFNREGMSIPESRVSMYSHITAGKIHKTNNNLYKLLTLIIWLIQPMKEEILT